MHALRGVPSSMQLHIKPRAAAPDSLHRLHVAVGRLATSSRCRRVVSRVSEKEAEEIAKGNLDAGLAAITKEVMQNDPETRESLKRYEAAMVRLEQARAASEELDRMFAEAAKAAAQGDRQDEEAERQRANEKLADAEVAAAERLLRAAEIEYEAAQRAKRELAAAATADADRGESLKAAAIAAAGGLLAELPLTTLAGGAGGAEGGALSGALSLLSAVAASFLFGVTYRYAVRGDADNKQLRLGVVAAFGLVRASGAADVLQATAAAGGDGPLSLAVVGPAALYALESLIVFGFASAAVEVAFSQGFLKRFGSEQ